MAVARCLAMLGGVEEEEGQREEPVEQGRDNRPPMLPGPPRLPLTLEEEDTAVAGALVRWEEVTAEVEEEEEVGVMGAQVELVAVIFKANCLPWRVEELEEGLVLAVGVALWPVLLELAAEEGVEVGVMT